MEARVGCDKLTKLGVMSGVLSAFTVYQVHDFFQKKEPNYFEILELDNSIPTTSTVKKRYQELMNKITQESGV